MMTTTLWRYEDPAWAETDLVGYDVEAVDGEIGQVESAIEEIGTRYLVVDARPWVFGKKVMLPAGIVDAIDVTSKRVHVGQTKAVIKRAPDLNEARHHDPRYREALALYYGRGRAATSVSA
jgi:hypothetical protein